MKVYYWQNRLKITRIFKQNLAQGTHKLLFISHVLLLFSFILLLISHLLLFIAYLIRPQLSE